MTRGLAVAWMAGLVACAGDPPAGATDVALADTGAEVTSDASADATSILGAPYVLALHTCKSDCGNPQNHTTHLAESADLVHWTLVAALAPYKGSVPDVVVRGDTLYLYNPGQLRRFSLATGAALGAPSNVQIKDAAGQRVDFVDPSPTLLPDGRIALFFLDSTGSHTDPARCPSAAPCTKYFRSATEDPDVDGAAFTLDPGDRVAIALDGGSASDPDIYQGAAADGWILAISRGTNTALYASATLTGSYVHVVDLANAGGVPAGLYDGAAYWHFGTHLHGGANVIDIRHAATLTGLASAPSDGLIDAASLGLEVGTNVESPGLFAR